MEATKQDQITQALERCETAHAAAEAAIIAKDAKQAPPLVFEALAVTLDALALCSRANVINPIENLLPSAVYYVRLLQTLAIDPFDLAQRLTVGSSIGVGER